MSPINVPVVEAATDKLLALDIRVLNAFLFAETELGHVRRLMEFMHLPAGAVVLDAGCGVGEIALLMQQLRPDLTFKLLNISQAQLDHCPEGMERVLGDFNIMPLADESVDVVMFNYAICHADDLEQVLRESRRVLKEGGSLFINDMSRESGSSVVMESLLHAKAHVRAELEGAAKRAGLLLDDVYAHEPVVHRLRALLEPGLFDLMFSGVSPTTWRFTRKTLSDPVASAFARHERIGFQFSGGRDSTAALYLLRPYWSRMTIYHLDTGDQFPETREVVRLVERDVGPVVRIKADVAAVRARYGMASDLVPVDNIEVGRMVSGREVKLISRYECCSRSLMTPMHERILSDGITLIVRGQRDDEYAQQPMRSGGFRDGLEVLYPVQSWSGPQVSDYLESNGHPIAPFYQRGVRRAPECMGCTAWWDEGRARYMREHHPEAYVKFIGNMTIVREEIAHQFAMLEGELLTAELDLGGSVAGETGV